jgi:hypothetical protein
VLRLVHFDNHGVNAEDFVCLVIIMGRPSCSVPIMGQITCSESLDGDMALSTKNATATMRNVRSFGSPFDVHRRST